MVGETPGEMELRLVVSRFREAVADWDLSPEETGALLGGASGAEEEDPLRRELGVEAETRLRLVIEVAHGLDRMFGPAELRAWLRDDEDGEVTPLEFISRGVTELRAMRAAIAARET